MILKAKHHFLIHPFFTFYAQWIIKRKFKKVHVSSDFEDEQLPILILANHISWWDGFWISYLNTKVLKRKFHFMMLEEQLRKFWFFNYAGGFSVRKNAKSIVESLRYTHELLQNESNMVFMFPQGKIESIYQNEIKFENGPAWILQKLDQKIHVLLMVNLIDYFSEPKPSLYIYLQEFKGKDQTTENLQQAYQSFYNQCLNKQKQQSNC